MEPEIRLTLRSWWPVVWLLFVLAAAILLPGRVWNTLLAGLGGLYVVAFLWARQLAKGLRGTRRLRFAWVSVGDRLSEQFGISNSSLLPAFWVEVVDGSNVPGYTAGVVHSVGGNDVQRWRTSAICQRRGQFRLGPWSLHSSDPFGLFRLQIYYPAGEEIIIYPPIHTQLPIPLPAGQSSGRTRTQERSWQASHNAASVRDYQPQDPYRWIHWPTSARQGSLYVRQFDLDASGDIWLVLDMEAAVQLGRDAAGTEEHLVLLAAALSVQAERQNRAVGLAAYGQTPRLLQPQRGRGQQWALLRALALLQADGNVPLQRALHDLGQIARRGSAAVILTPAATATWLPALFELARLGVEANVILLERMSFGGPENSRGLQQAIQAAGFSCHLLRQGEVGRPVEDEEQRGFWEFKTTPTGKVVVVRSPEFLS